MRYADGLRALADWYEAHPEMPTPSSSDELKVFAVQGAEGAARVLRALAPCTKRYSDDFGLLYIERDFGGGVRLSFVFSRDEVCVRKVVGTEEVAEVSIPAHVVPAHTREIVKWECEPILAAAEVEAEAVSA